MMYKHQTVVYNLYNAAKTASNRAQKKATIPLPTLRAYRGGSHKNILPFFIKGVLTNEKEAGSGERG